jgi:hypothetical protein
MEVSKYEISTDQQEKWVVVKEEELFISIPTPFCSRLLDKYLKTT